MPETRFRWAPGLMALLMLGLAGCKGENPPPKTYAVSGKVVAKGANIKLLVGSYVHFQLVSNPSVVAVGEIEDDGNFTLGTVYEGKSLPGALAGEYRVRLQVLEDEEGQPRRIIHPRFTDFEKSRLKFTVKPDEDNVFTIPVEAGG